MAVDTGKVTTRRKVEYASLQDVLADAERMASGNPATLGNWSAGQIFAHLARSFNNSIDGAEYKAPWYFRLLGRILKKQLLNGPMSPGFKLPAWAAGSLEPAPTSTEEGLNALRNAVARQERESTRVPDPVFGPMSPEEWRKLHLKHAALHMSFLVPQG
jgi:hypothetical protein